MKEESSISNLEQVERVDTEDIIRQSVKEGGFLLDAAGRDLNLKTAKDGHTVLIPQPSDDPNDPLNWSTFKKHAILFTIAWGAMTADFTSAAGIPCIFLQGAEWKMEPSHVSYANNLNVLMMGIGGLLWIPVINFWGRAPVLFWACLCGTLFTVGAAAAPNFPVHYAMRATMGVFLTAPQVISIAFIKDMFFFHENARKIGLWASLYISSPYLGPLLANFIIAGTANWRAVFWMCVGVGGIQFALILLFLDEPYYNRALSLTQQPTRGNRILRLLGIWQIQNHHGYFYSVKAAYRRWFATITQPALLVLLAAYFMTFMWAIGINITTAILFQTPISYGGYGFSAKGVGFLYFTPIVAVILGEIFGHWFNDFIAERSIRRHHGVFEPEARLTMNFISVFIMVPGLVLVGMALQHHLNYSAIIVGWGTFNFGIMTTSVAVTAYAIDSYGMAPGEVSGFINFMRVIGGFSVGYFQQPWGAKIGFGASFGTQAAIVGASLIPLCLLRIYGKALRRKGLVIE